LRSDWSLDPLEIAVEHPFGAVDVPRRRPPPVEGVRDALDALLADLLAAGPTGVLFSGGRDSSALLAVAVLVARRQQLPEPIAVTCVYPEHVDLDETAAQHAVIGAVRPADWLRIEIRDEMDVVGPAAQLSLRRHGYLYPATVQSWDQIYAAVPGYRLIDGEGGDEVLGPLRASPLAHLRRRRGRPYPGRRGDAALALAPGVVRRAAARRASGPEAPTWLRPEARREYLRRLANELAAEPLDWRAAVRRQPRLRGHLIGAESVRLVAQSHGVEVVSPLLHPRFLDALAARGGPLGFASRTTAMNELFGDVVPACVVRRHTKASFNQVFCGRHSREFATKWDGAAGIDSELVDAEALRASWLSSMPHGASFALLQHAWLATVRAA
jgi:asparagine synthase (glutamine-hydrolysing)